jgi:palmitoyltransferase ZDHHC13/17
VQVFDHFCPWVGNSIGKGNRHLFITFVSVMCVTIVLAYVVSMGRLRQTGIFGWGPRKSSKLSGSMAWIILWLICNVPLLLTLVGLTSTQLVQARFHLHLAHCRFIGECWMRVTHLVVFDIYCQDESFFELQAAQNMTTNEMSNWPRYKHFRQRTNEGNTFHNPFDKGVLKNYHEVCFPSSYPMLPAFVESPEMESMRRQLDSLAS